MFGKGDPELDGSKLDVEGGYHLHFGVNQILACLDDL